MHVKVYRNLNTGKWSVVNLRTGHVCMHADRLTLKDATFHVQPAGNARVRREGVKNVHAYVKGTLMSLQLTFAGEVEVKYNPYAVDYFYLRTSPKEKIESAPFVEFMDDGSAWVGWE